MNDQFVVRGLSNKPNSPEEIKEAVIELMGRLDGTIVYTDEVTNRQAEFWALFRNGHYTYGARSTMGRDFLRSYMTT